MPAQLQPAPDGEWIVSGGARLDWQSINTSSLALGVLRFGDFNGDGRADVFYGNGTTWSIGDGEYVFAYGAQGGRRRGETCSGAVFTFSCSTVLTWVVHPFRRSHVLA